MEKHSRYLYDYMTSILFPSNGHGKLLNAIFEVNIYIYFLLYNPCPDNKEHNFNLSILVLEIYFYLYRL